MIIAKCMVKSLFCKWNKEEYGLVCDYCQVYGEIIVYIYSSEELMEGFELGRGGKDKV